ncbi:hypothetical protein O0L34_g1554 [Tuta absoluta]|nr:hypothetical protein O0L34_g1554 [Tuta absoluta]
MPREKSRYRDRRSSSYSSDSSYDRKKSKSKHKRRSRSRDRSESSSHRRKRSTSRSRHKRRSYSRSPSRDRYEKSRRRSTSRSRSRRERSLSRSSSRSRKYKSSKKSRRRSRSSSSRSGSYEIERPAPTKVNLDDTESKLEKAIKAAEAAGLTMTKIPTYEYKEVEIKEEMPSIHDRNLLAELNSDSFIQKPFVSSSKKKESKNIVIDLNAQTVKVPDSDIKQKDESIIDFNEIPNEEELKEMWIKKLYQFRKRMLKGEI